MAKNDTPTAPYAALAEQIERLGRDLIEFYRRSEEREAELQGQLNSLHRLAGLGTLVAGVSHDAANLLLPLRMTIEHLENEEMSDEARRCVQTIKLTVQQFQNSVVNLRWLSAQSVFRAGGIARPGATPASEISLRPGDWARDVAAFHTRMSPLGITLSFDVPDDLPLVRITSAALSQAVFNLIRNAQQAIASAFVGRGPVYGKIVVRGARCTDASGAPAVEIAVRDDGPGMTPEVLARCTEPFFTTRGGTSGGAGGGTGGSSQGGTGTGLGLALVRTLVLGCGAQLTFFSPPRGEPEGTRGLEAVITLPLATSE